MHLVFSSFEMDKWQNEEVFRTIRCFEVAILIVVECRVVSTVSGLN